MPKDQPAIEGGAPVRETPLAYGGQSIGDAEKENVLDVLESDYITRGPKVSEFEEAVADRIGVDHAVAVTSGTAALHLTGAAAGFGPGDEVITTPLTFISTANTACYTGAEPVFADIKQSTRNIDPAAVRDRITEDTVGLVPVHYAGLPCNIDELLEIAEENDLTVIWDACHALGGTWDGEPIGSQPDMAIFSFHPVKNITTAEGGMVVTDDDYLAQRLRSLRSFEMDYDPPGHEDEPWYQVTRNLGYNYNFTDIQAALGLAQLDRIDAFKRRRQEIVDRYNQELASIRGLETPPNKANADVMWHLYTVEIGPSMGCSRKQFVNAMHEENIYVQVHYVPLHYHPYIQQQYGYTVGEYPETESLYERIVSLPLFPEMSDGDVDDVVAAVERVATYYAEE